MMRLKSKKTITTFMAIVMLSLAILVSFAPRMQIADADDNPASWILCKFEDGQVMYKAAVTDLIPYTLRSKSTSAKTERVDSGVLNSLLRVAGYDFVNPNVDVLGRSLSPTSLEYADPESANASAPSVTAFQRFGMAGLRFSSYHGEWKYYEINPCDSSQGVAKTNFGKYYDTRKEPTSTYEESSLSTDPRTIQFSRGLMSAWASEIANVVANLIFSIAKGVVTLTIIFVGLSFSDITQLLGLSVSGEASGAALSIFNSLFNSLFIPLVVLISLLSGIYLMYNALIKRQVRDGIRKLALSILVFILSYIMMSNPGFWISAPNNIATLGQSVVVTAMTGEDRNENICIHSPASANLSGYEATGERIKNNIACKLWKEFLLEPWALGQFGVPYSQLEAVNIDNINESWVGSPKVPLGNGRYSENWALFQLSTQTNAHAQQASGSNVPVLVSGVSTDWWKIADALSNYDEKLVTETIEGTSETITYIEQTGSEPIAIFEDWSGNDSASRIGTALIASIFAVIGSVLPLTFGLLSSVYGIALYFLMLVAPVFMLAGTHSGRGQEAFKGWLSLLLNTMIKKVVTGLLLMFSIEIVAASMDMISNVGYFQALVALVILTAVVYINRNAILNMLASVDIGGSWNPINTFNRASHKAKEQATQVGNIALGTIAGARAAQQSGQSILEGARIGAGRQLHNNLYRSRLGSQAAIQYNSTINGRHSLAGEFCHYCGIKLETNSLAYVNKEGDTYCQWCGEEVADDTFSETIITGTTEKKAPNFGRDRSINATSNSSWLSYSKSKELGKIYHNAESKTLTWDEDSVKKMIEENIKSLAKDIFEFKANYEYIGRQANPPTIPEPIQEYLDLALVNEAWSNNDTEYVEQMYREGWKIWYLSHAKYAEDTNFEESVKWAEEFTKASSYELSEAEKKEILSNSDKLTARKTDDDLLYSNIAGQTLATGKLDSRTRKQDEIIDAKHKEGKGNS